MLEQPGLTVAPLDACARLALHCNPADAPAFAEAGLTLPADILRSTARDGWHALHLGPDEWLLVGPPDQREAMIARIGDVAVPHSLVDISARNVGVVIEGGDAATLLNSGCPLDLSDAAFPPGACTRTLFGKLTIMLWRPDERPRYIMEYTRSFDRYAVEFIRTVARDLRRS